MKLSTFLATMAVSSGLLFSVSTFAQEGTQPAPVKGAQADVGCAQVQSQSGMDKPAKIAAPMKKKAKPVKLNKRSAAPRAKAPAPAQAPVPPAP